MGDEAQNLHNQYADNVFKLCRESFSILQMNEQDRAEYTPFHAASKRFYRFVDGLQMKLAQLTDGSGFEYDREKHLIRFAWSGISSVIKIYDKDDQFYGNPSEINPEIRLACLNAVMLYIAHELVHHQQKMSNYSTVDVLKFGLDPLGLPIVDVAADTLAAFLCASAVGNKPTEDEKCDGELSDTLGLYVSFLIRAYEIGTEAFDAKSKPAKRQRALGLLMQAALVHAKLSGSLKFELINECWEVDTPLLAVNVMSAMQFNAAVICNVPGLLYEGKSNIAIEEGMLIWEAVGEKSSDVVFKMVSDILINSGAIQPLSPTSPPNNAP